MVVTASKVAYNGSGPDCNRGHHEDNRNITAREGNKKVAHDHMVAYSLDLGEEQHVDAAEEDTFSSCST